MYSQMSATDNHSFDNSTRIRSIGIRVWYVSDRGKRMDRWTTHMRR